jgi:hypothetical protein
VKPQKKKKKNINRVIKQRRVCCSQQVAHLLEMKNDYEISVINFEGYRLLGRRL